MAGLFDSILARSRPDWVPTPDAAFPELTPEAPKEDDSWLSKLPQTMLPPKLRKKELAGVDASNPSIALALSQQPGLGAGMITGVDQPPFLNPTERAMQAAVGGDPGPAVPMPAPRPPGADATPATAPTDVSASARPPGPPVSLAPPEAPQGQQAPVPVPAGAAPSEIPSILSRIRTTLGDNSNTLLALGAGLAGAPNVGQGISRAAAAAIPARAADIKQSLDAQSRTYGTRALVEAGVPIQQAIAAQADPELKKALIQNYIVDRKHELKTVKDWMGNESLVDFDPFTSKAKPVVMEGGGAGGEGASGGSAPSSGPGIMSAARLEPQYDPSTHRDEAFLDAVKKADPLTGSAIEDIANGRMPATGRNLQKVMPLVSRYENGFDNTRYQARQALEKSYYGGGEGAKALRSANTTIDHGIKLSKAIDDLHNYSILPGYINAATGKFAENIGDKKYQDAIARFNSAKEVYSKELEFALTGKNTVSGTKAIEALFDKYGAPTANKAALQQTLESLQQRVDEHETTYNNGMNKKGQQFGDMLSKRAELNKLLGQDTGSGEKTAAPAAAPALKPGGSYKMLPDGTLVPK